MSEPLRYIAIVVCVGALFWMVGSELFYNNDQPAQKPQRVTTKREKKRKHRPQMSWEQRQRIEEQRYLQGGRRRRILQQQQMLVQEEDAVVQKHFAAAKYTARLLSDKEANEALDACINNYAGIQPENWRNALQYAQSWKLWAVVRDEGKGNFATFFAPHRRITFFRKNVKSLSRRTLGIVVLHECRHVWQYLQGLHPDRPKYFQLRESEAWTMTARFFKKLGGQKYRKMLKAKKEEIYKLHEKYLKPLGQYLFSGKQNNKMLKQVWGTVSVFEANFVYRNLVWQAYRELYENTFTQQHIRQKRMMETLFRNINR